MPPERKSVFLAQAGLVATLLALFVFAGSLRPQALAQKKTNIALLQRIVGQTGESHEVNLLVNKPGSDLRAALSLDISNRHAILGSLQIPGALESTYIDEENGRAFLANSFSGLQIVDISDPKHLSILGSLLLPGKCWDIKVMGNTLYLASADEGLFLIDISSVENPTILSHLKIPDHYFLKLALSGNIIYAISGKRGLLVVDVGNARAPRLINTLYRDDGVWGLLTDNAMLYVSCGKYRLETLDISIPDSPRKTGGVTVPDAAWDMAIREKILYLPTQKAGLIMVDVNRAEQPLRLHHTLGVRQMDNIDLHQDRGYMSSRTGHLNIIDLADPKAPQPLGTFNLPFKPRNINVAGGHLFTSTGLAGLHVIAPDALTPIDQSRQLDVPGRLQTVLFDDQFYYLATRSHGLHIAGRNADALPGKIVSTLPLPGSIENMVKIDNHLYLAGKDCGLLVVDISAPETPQLVIEFKDAGKVLELVAIEKYLVLATREYGIRVFDTSTSNNPQEIGALPLLLPLPVDYPVKLATAGNYLYVATGKAGLQVIALTNPKAPVLLGALAPPWPLQNFITAKSLAVSGTTAYLAAGLAGLLIIDISKPDLPKLKEILDLNGEVMAVAVNHDKIYTTTRQGKLWTLLKNPDGPSHHVAASDILGPGIQLTIHDNQAIIANGKQGLTLLPLPREIELEAESITKLRAGRPAQMSLRIPAQSTPGIYNLTLVSENEKSEFIGVLNLKEAGRSARGRN